MRVRNRYWHGSLQLSHLRRIRIGRRVSPSSVITKHIVRTVVKRLARFCVSYRRNDDLQDPSCATPTVTMIRGATRRMITALMTIHITITITIEQVGEGERWTGPSVLGQVPAESFLVELTTEEFESCEVAYWYDDYPTYP